MIVYVQRYGQEYYYDNRISEDGSLLPQPEPNIESIETWGLQWSQAPMVPLASGISS